MKIDNAFNSKTYRDLGLYIHIPFCAKKCDYCDFLSAPASQETINEYFDAMLTEIESYSTSLKDYIVPTIFFGGGTPSLVDAVYIERMMKAINQIFRIDNRRLEATIEINPGTVTEDKLQTYKRIGINRLSFGLQSANNEELSILGRIHTYEKFEKNYFLARQLGFQNINIDLMSALPGQTVQTWENTLNKIVGLKPEHISAYSLIIEEGTKFYEQYQAGSDAFWKLPDEETDRLIYHRTKEILQANGYHRYEISNYAKAASYECRHNSSYWVGTDYLGLGLGASSLMNGARFSNLLDCKQYIERCTGFNKNYINMSKEDQDWKNQRIGKKDSLGLRMNYEKLTKQQRMEEFMFLGLRMCAGVSKNTYFQRFGEDIDTIYGEILRRMMEKKLLEIKNDNIRLTDYGIDISNYVLSEFLLG
ncbi:MAG: radical SAM family heme chaperone HemW [Herbinix sp.]|nr:radical SAM family heme chaperone HemW [Herbinix sp.]